MKKIRLSHSSVDKYTTCNALYKNHYIDKVRPIKIGSALFFGNAIDEALNIILLAKKPNLTKSEEGLSKLEPINVFTSNMNNYRYNNQMLNLKTSPNVSYFKSDIDMTLLEESDLEEIKKFDSEVDDLDLFLKECSDILSSKSILSEKDQQLYNFIAWHSLHRKGIMLINTYLKDIFPKIHTVFSIQNKITLPDEEGNTLIGYEDAIVSFNNSPDTKVILDHKTSSKPYPENSVSISTQLATYSEYEGIYKGAFVVLEKYIRKREPRVRTQLIVGDILESTIVSTFDNYQKALTGIKNGVFNKNYESGCFMYGKPCPYYKYCKSNGSSMEGLIKLKDSYAKS